MQNHPLIFRLDNRRDLKLTSRMKEVHSKCYQYM